MGQSLPPIGGEVVPVAPLPPIGSEVPQAGGAPAPEPVMPSALSRFGSELYAKSPIPAAVGAITGAAHVMSAPRDTYFGLAPLADTAKGLLKAQWDQAVQAAAKAKEAAHGGGALSASEAFGHGLAAILPILGPAAADVGEHFARGDIAGGAGGTTALLAPFAVKAAMEATHAPNLRKADLLRRDAEQTVSQRVLAPGNPRYKGTAEQIAPEVLTRNLQGSRLELQQLADEGMDAAGTAIDAAIPQNWTVSTGPVIGRLQQRIAELSPNGTPVPTAAARVKALIALRDDLKARPRTMPYETLKGIRDEFYRAADEAKGYSGPDVTLPDRAWAAREAGSAIRAHVAAQNPQLAAAHADFTFFKRLGDVLDPTLGRPKHVSASPTGVTGGNSTAGAIIGHAAAAGSKIPGLQGAAALVASRLLPALLEAKNSPAWQLATAARKMSLAAAIEAGNMSKATTILLTMSQAAPRQNDTEEAP
jgi:hypothetical protein